MAPGRKKSLATCRHWVFDLDGTLTLPVHDFDYIRLELGVPAGSDILEWLGTLPDQEAGPRHARLNEIEHELIDRTAPAPGAHNVISHLHANGARLGILTRNTRQIALHTLRHIGLDTYFTYDFILGRNEALPKPDPDGILQLAAHWETTTDEMVMVGDYLYDLQTGRAAGAFTVHVRGTRPHGWPEWTDFEVASLEELAELLGDE
jgi:HAD superfamily hydrolase (TIGR01509 family)